MLFSLICKSVSSGLYCFYQRWNLTESTWCKNHHLRKQGFCLPATMFHSETITVCKWLFCFIVGSLCVLGK